MVLPKLVLSNFAVHRARAALTIAAIALSVSLVVAVTTGYASMIGAAEQFLGVYMGTSDLSVTHSKGDPHGTFSQSFADMLRADSQATKVLSRYGTGTTVFDETGKSTSGFRSVDLIGIVRPEDTAVDSMPLEAGAWFDVLARKCCRHRPDSGRKVEAESRRHLHARRAGQTAKTANRRHRPQADHACRRAADGLPAAADAPGISR